MSKDQRKKIGFKERMRESYRLVIYRSDNFQEVRSFDLSLGSIYVAISMLTILVAIIYFAVFALTPLKKIIPGYGKMEVNPQFIELIESVDALSNQIEAQESYISAVKKLVSIAADRGEDQDYSVATPAAAIKSSNKISPTKPLNNEVSLANSAEDADFKEETEIYLALNGTNVIAPVDGVTSSSFQPEIRHFGIDILAPKNSPVRAIMDGFVFSSGWDLETGYTLGIQHKGNILSFYKHNSILLKEKGTFVRAGEAVAIIGNTGTLSSGPHLHFELWHNGKPVNPKDFINF